MVPSALSARVIVFIAPAGPTTRRNVWVTTAAENSVRCSSGSTIEFSGWLLRMSGNLPNRVTAKNDIRFIGNPGKPHKAGRSLRMRRRGFARGRGGGREPTRQVPRQRLLHG